MERKSSFHTKTWYRINWY